MSFMSAVAGGGVLSEVAAAAGLDEATAKAAMDSLSLAIANRLQEKAKADPDLLDELLALLDDNSAEDGPAGEEAMLDGNAVLKALYGSKATALKALQPVAEVGAEALAVLAPVSAAAVIAAVAHQQKSSLSGALPLAGGSVLGTLVSAIIAGAVREAVRQITSSTRRRTSTSSTRTSSRSRKKTTAKKPKTTRKRSTSGIDLEDILGGLFGTKNK